MNSFVAYDIEGNQDAQIDAAMIDIGYWTRWRRSNAGDVFYLPRRCLWKPNNELKTAQADILRIIETLNTGIPETSPNRIKLLRCVVLSVDPWEGIPGIHR
jgi:hypothetical protein